MKTTDQGKIIETGTHDSLVQIPDGFYRRLVEAQQISAEKDKSNPAAVASTVNGASPKQETHKSLGRTKSIRSVRSTKSRRSGTYSRKGSKGLVAGDDINAFMRTVALNRPEAPMILGGILGAIITGITQPVFAVLFGHIILSLIGPAGETDFWALMFLIIGGCFERSQSS